MSIQNQKDIALLIVKYLQEDLSEEEKRRLDAWRGESARNEAAFQKYLSKDFYATMKILYTPGEEGNLYKRLRKKLTHKRVRMIRRRVVWNSVAILLFFFTWGVIHYFAVPDSSQEAWVSQTCIEQIEPGSRQAVLYLPDGQTQRLVASARKIHVNGLTKVLVTDGMELVFPEIEPEEKLARGMNRIEVPRGGEYQLRLNDKTHIYLNSESELQFPTMFETESREIAFSGEAYFDVAHTEPYYPFIINTSMGKVTVLGTTFNLRCYDSSGLLQLTLEKGKVRFVTPDGKRQAEVHPGEQLVYDSRRNSISIRCVPTYLYTSWKDGIYSLDQTPLEEIMENLSRWYDVPIVYESEELKHITFTGEIKRYGNFGEVIQIFELTKRVRFRMKGNTIYIMRE